MGAKWNRIQRSVFGWKGDKGETGETGATGAAGSVGETGAAGSPGVDGSAATITVGTVTTGAAGSSASVTNSGTSSAAIFDMTIPAGADGAGTGDMVATTYDPIIKAITGESTVGATPDITLAAIAAKRDVKIPVLINPAADAISVPVYFETAATLYKVILTSTKATDSTNPPTSSSIFTTPSASTTIKVYGLSGSTVTELDSNAMTTASLSHTLSTPATIPAQSWVFIKIVGAVNGITALSAGLVVG